MALWTMLEEYSRSISDSPTSPGWMASFPEPGTMMGVMATEPLGIAASKLAMLDPAPGLDEGLSDDGEALIDVPGVALGQEIVSVVHSGDVLGTEEVRLIGERGVVGAEGADAGPGAEVGEVKDGGGEGSERGRKRELGGGSEVELGFSVAARAEAVKLGAEGLLDRAAVPEKVTRSGAVLSTMKPRDWSQDSVAAMSASAMPKRAAKSSGVSQ